jgi:hypothetical protein
MISWHGFDLSGEDSAEVEIWLPELQASKNQSGWPQIEYVGALADVAYY